MSKSSFTPSFLIPSTSLTHGTRDVLSEEDWARLQHPDDKAAIAAMENLPGFSMLMKTVLTGVYEKFAYGINMGSALRLGPAQLPEYYNLLPPVCEKLGLREIPEFYLKQDPTPNAWTSGEQRVYITMTSGLMQLLTPEDIQTVLAHECGHILFKHVRYSMLAQTLSTGLELIPIAGTLISAGLKPLMCRWMRMAELSCDRAGLLWTGNLKKSVRVSVCLAAGSAALVENFNHETYLAQAEECENILHADGFDGLLQKYTLWDMTHPFAASRAHHLAKFYQTSLYKNTVRRMGTYCCPTCGCAMRTENICVNGHFV